MRPTATSRLEGGPRSATWRPMRSRGGAATGAGRSSTNRRTSPPAARNAPSGTAATSHWTQPTRARLASGKRPHASRHVPEPLSDTNMSGPAPVQAARPSTAAAPDRSGIRSASASARASGRTRDARPVAEGISGVRASPVRSSVAAWRRLPFGTRRTSRSPIRYRRPERAVAAASPYTASTKSHSLEANPASASVGRATPRRIHAATRPSPTTKSGRRRLSIAAMAARSSDTKVC